MPRFAPVFAAMILCTTLAACGPSAEEVATMTAAWTDTPTATPAATATATNTPTATLTLTATPTVDTHYQELKALIEENTRYPYWPQGEDRYANVGKYLLHIKTVNWIIVSTQTLEGVELQNAKNVSNELKELISKILIVNLLFPDDQGYPQEACAIAGFTSKNGDAIYSLGNQNSTHGEKEEFLNKHQGQQWQFDIRISRLPNSGQQWPIKSPTEYFIAAFESAPNEELEDFVLGNTGHKLPEGHCSVQVSYIPVNESDFLQ